jgi:[ribosomal protein S18]-alanine N-acetyltransferase
MLTATRYYVRPMTEADISQVADIEGESFPTTWPRTAYKRELSNRLARYLVLIDRTQAAVQPPPKKRRRFSFAPFFKPHDEAEPTTDYVVGYVGVWLMVDEAHIVAIAVRESYRRQGLGERLLYDAIELALSNKQENVTLEVRRSNTSAQALYEKYRFLNVGVRKRYYSDNHEDAIVMSTPPIQHENYTEHLAYLREQMEKRWARDG